MITNLLDVTPLDGKELFGMFLPYSYLSHSSYFYLHLFTFSFSLQFTLLLIHLLVLLTMHDIKELWTCLGDLEQCMLQLCSYHRGLSSSVWCAE